MATTIETSQLALKEKRESFYAAAVKSNTEGVKRSIELNPGAKTLLARNMTSTHTQPSGNKKKQRYPI